MKSSKDYHATNLEILNSIQKDSFEDRAYGCILGAFIGDSVGSFLFNSNKENGFGKITDGSE